jgi:hypothetical protein
MKSFAKLMFALSISLFLTSSHHAAEFCIMPDVLGAVERAELVFSGRIIDLTPLMPKPDEPHTTSKYIVRFAVEKWWKGTKSNDVHVLWSSSTSECDYLPVGKIGERYLVYADPALNNQVNKKALPEVTAFNRTSRLDLGVEQMHDSSGKNRLPRLVDSKPPLDRADASGDIKVLRVLMECKCLTTNSDLVCWDLPLSSLAAPIDVSSSGASQCCKCLRQHLKLF